MEQGDKIVLAIVVGAIIIGVAIFVSFGLRGGVSGEAVREIKEVKEVVHFDGVYECNSDVYNCDSFDSREEAQDVFEVCGGVEHDVHRLDGDGDGVVCEGMG